MGKIEIQHRTDFTDRQHKTERKETLFLHKKKLSTLTLQKKNEMKQLFNRRRSREFCFPCRFDVDHCVCDIHKRELIFFIF
jgi:hypothetical protein